MIKYLLLKRQIRKLSRQIDAIVQGNSEKMLDISFIDGDLEKLAGDVNRYITRQRYMVGHALQHEEHLKESIANISHDLRTPLTVITGHLQLLNKSSLTTEQNRRVETMLHKTGRMNELIGTFYELSILDSDEVKPKKEKINLSNLLMDFLTENAPLIMSKQGQPEIILPNSSVCILSDRNMIERIFQNLLTNALRYSAGRIKISLSKEDNKISFGIENTIQDEVEINIERIFERFYTGDKSRHSESTGLGLAVVKLLVEKLDAQLEAKVLSNKLVIKIIFEKAPETSSN